MNHGLLPELNGSILVGRLPLPRERKAQRKEPLFWDFLGNRADSDSFSVSCSEWVTGSDLGNNVEAFCQHISYLVGRKPRCLAR